MALQPYSNTGLYLAPYTTPKQVAYEPVDVRDAFPYTNVPPNGKVGQPATAYIPTLSQSSQALTPNAKKASFLTRLLG